MCLCYCRMVDIEVQTQSQVIQADSEGEADPTYSPSYLSGDDDIYLDDETLASFMSKKKAKASVQPPSDEDNEQSDKDSWHSEELKSPISTDDEDDEKVVFPIFNPNSTFGQVHLELGMEFENLDLFKDALRDYTIHLGREFVWKKNDRERVRAKCKEQECKWEIFCSWNKGEKCFQVKTFNSEHSCARVFKNKTAKKKWISKKLEAKIRQQPTITYIQAFDYLKEEF